jgi:hypothetical protein
MVLIVDSFKIGYAQGAVLDNRTGRINRMFIESGDREIG